MLCGHAVWCLLMDDSSANENEGAGVFWRHLAPAARVAARLHRHRIERAPRAAMNPASSRVRSECQPVGIESMFDNLPARASGRMLCSGLCNRTKHHRLPLAAGGSDHGR